MNRQDYIAEVERQLKDKKYYTELNENPCERFKQEIQTKISTILDSEWLNNISDINIPSENRIPQFYILPKIHKTHFVIYHITIYYHFADFSTMTFERFKDLNKRYRLKSLQY